MGGVGKYFERKRKPKTTRLCLPLGMACTFVFLIFFINSWTVNNYKSSRRYKAREARVLSLSRRGGSQQGPQEIAESSGVEVNIKSPLESDPDHRLKRKSRLDAQFKNFKTILYWNDAYGKKDFGFGFGQEPFLAANCRVNQCYATHDKRTVAPEEADAILWHLRAKNKSFPTERSPHTFYIFYVMESALYTYADLRVYNGIFNWTMTYRLDSDFPKPYGAIKPPPADMIPLATENKNYAAGKTKLAAWFVSNCKTISDREHLVQTLRNYIEVDVYGRCGSLRCSRSKQDKCLKMLHNDYKFYFAFENSLCIDYITEKFFQLIKYDVVPVVYGLGYRKLDLPDHSYIDVLDFRSLDELSDYLLYLDYNDTAYNEYFRWKEMGYQVIEDEIIRNQSFCDLCERLHQAHDLTHSQEDPTMNEGNLNDEFQPPIIKEKYRKIYTNLHKWFVADKCTEPYGNRKLAAFIHGKEVSIQQRRREEEELPFLLRPNRIT